MWFLPRFMRKHKASISLFMAIIMLSMFMLSAVINDAARLRAARTIVQSAADSAALSVLAKYDNVLKDKYGLFVLEETDKDAVIEDFTDFFVENLSSEYPLSSDFKQSLTTFLQTVGADGITTDRDTPVDMYDYDLADTSIDLAYSIIEPSVMQTQMAEFAKYRGFISMTFGNQIDLSELTEKAEESSKDLEKIKETVSSDSGTDGSSYKTYVDDACSKYYELTQKLRSVNFAINMCANHKQEYFNNQSGGLFGQTNEWLPLTYPGSSYRPGENMNAYIDDIVSKSTTLRDNANNIIKELDEYDRLKGIENQKQAALNTANANLSAAQTEKAAADTALQNAKNLKTQVENLEKIKNNVKDFFSSSYCNGTEWDNEKNTYNSITWSAYELSTKYSIDDYMQFRIARRSNSNSSIPKIEGEYSTETTNLRRQAEILYTNAIAAINSDINNLNNQAVGANNASSAETSAQNRVNSAQTAVNNANAAVQTATNEYNAAVQASQAQYNKLKSMCSGWNTTIKNCVNGNGIYDRGIDKAVAEIKKLMGYSDSSNVTLKYCERKMTEGKFNEVGIKGAVNVTKNDYGTAQSSLSSAISQTNAYINTVTARKNADAAAGNDTSMDEALLKDAQTALDELNNIKAKSTAANPSITTFLDKTNEYINNVNSSLPNISNSTSNLMQLRNNYIQTSNADPVEYLRNSVRIVVSYNNSGNSNLEAYKLTINSYRNNYNGSYYDKHYVYAPKEIKEHGSSGSSYNKGTTKNLFKLFDDFDMNDFKDNSAISGSNKIISDTSALPSVLYEKDYANRYHTYDKFKADDEAYIKKVKAAFNLASMSSPPVGNTGATTDQALLDSLQSLNISDSASSQSSGFGLLKNLMDGLKGFTNDMTDGLLVDYYDMSMFKTRVTKSPEEWKAFYENDQHLNISSDLKNKNFDMERYSKDKEDRNLYFKSKNESTYFRSEIEYILEGKYSEKTNRNNVYLKIYGIRMVNNLIAMYKDDGIRNLASSASTWAGPFAPLIQLAIIAVLAALETYFDMEFLITYGYKIPFWKTPDNLTLSLDNLKSKLSSASDSSSIINGLLKTPNCDGSRFLVSYETYLWFFILLTGKENKLLRSADLMQLNIRETSDPTYRMADHYTYVRCYTKATVKPMFVGLGFAPSEFDAYNHRYDVESLNYQGY